MTEQPTPDALGTLLTTSARVASLVHLEEIPAPPGVPAPWPDWADPRLVAGYAKLGIAQPWRHQVEAARSVHEGHHTVIATATGSGKSLAAWLPTLTGILAGTSGAGETGSIARLQRRPSALYLSPTKALAADQLASLTELLRASGLASELRVTTCDGDSSPEDRDWARNHADVVLTNPDFLHFALLPGHERWTRLLRTLSVVVLDEAHAYRGVFGAHVSLVLRRLLRLARALGAEPVVVAMSATAGEPDLTLARLVGVPPAEVTAVVESTAPQGRRRIALWEPPPVESPEWEDWGGGNDGGSEAGNDGVWAQLPGVPDDVVRRSAQREVADLLVDLVGARRRTLAFVRSRAGVETVAAIAQERLARWGDHSADWGQNSGENWGDDWGEDAVEVLARGGALPVAAYRGGYLPEERRALEAALRDGRLLGLATTNALELGIDVSGLDVVLLAGWPGTRVSFWQQVGRAGRAGADGLAVLVAGANPLDTYLVHHPDAILREGVEATTFDPANPYVLAPHLCAAAAERPLTQDDLPLFGLTGTELLEELVRRGLLRRRPGGWYWNQARDEVPSRLTDLRGSGARGVAVVDAASGTVLGTVDGAASDATVHPGAVYVHQGRTFVVESLDDDVALVRAELVEHRTSARSARHAALLEVRERRLWGPVTWAYGLVEVTSQVQSYDVRRPPSMEVVASSQLDLPLRTLPTTGVWWSTPAEVLQAETGIAPADIPGALHAAEHAAIGVLPLLATCDRWDIGGISTALHPDTGAPTVLVHDGHPGGAGFAERGFRAASAWMRATFEAVASCRCTHGCPRCVYSPKCGNGNAPLDKAGAVAVLRLLVSLSPD